MSRILLIVCLIFASANAIAQSVIVEDRTRKIEVTGSAQMEIAPDEVFVTFTLQEYYNKQKTKIDIDAIQKDFLDRCSKAGITKENISVQNMSGFDQSNWYWRKRKKEQPDMMASTSYIIKFNSAAGIDKLVNTLDDNATQNMYVSKTSHSKMEDFRKEVKIKALQAAKAKAQSLCESIGEKIGKTIYIEEINDQMGMPMYKNRNVMANQMEMADASANEGIDFQKLTIRYEMLARFEIQ